MNRFTRFIAAVALLAAGFLMANPVVAADSQYDAKLSVLHGVPGAVVDVYVDDVLTLDDFTPGSLAGPLSLPAGTYVVTIVAGTDPDNSNPIIGPAPLPLEASMNYTAVAHLDAVGAPTASLFTNDTTVAGIGKGKITARHTAANAEGVEVVLEGTSLGTFDNGDQIGPAGLDAGVYSVEIKAGDVVVPPTPADVPVSSDQNTIVYAWGDASDLQLAVQFVDLEYNDPTAIPTLGTLGMALMVTIMLLVGARRFTS